MIELDVLLALYFGGWVIVTVGLYVAGRRFAEGRAPNALGVSVLGGAVWPLLLVGVVEASSIVVLTKLRTKPAPEIRLVA